MFSARSQLCNLKGPISLAHAHLSLSSLGGAGSGVGPRTVCSHVKWEATSFWDLSNSVARRPLRQARFLEPEHKFTSCIIVNPSGSARVPREVSQMLPRTCTPGQPSTRHHTIVFAVGIQLRFVQKQGIPPSFAVISCATTWEDRNHQLQHAGNTV